jgi:Dolichyl-phosphate-mannose-protein mannosyltransferase
LMPEQVPATSESAPGTNSAPHSSLPTDVIAWLVIVATAATTLYISYSRGLSNLYGDGIAHMEGARRLFDSLTPGYQEIGTVWLPLYHLLVAPLARNDFLWRTGLGGSLVSTCAFGVTAFLLYRLAFQMNRSVASAWVALLTFLICPSMMYIASTPLTEPLTLLWAVLTVYGLFRYQQTGSRRMLVGAAAAAFLGTLTRYDGWFLLPFAAMFVFFARREPVRDRFRHAIIFSMIAGAGPFLWLVHNAVRFGNALEFYNGPFSAQAIYARQVATTGFHYPTDGGLLISARYYLADLTLVMGPWPLELAVLGLALWALEARERARRAAALLFLVPFVFYVDSMAHAAVALYVPTLFPNTYYNLRYGIEMLPAVAIFPSFLITWRTPVRLRAVLAGVIVFAVLGQFTFSIARGIRELPVVQESIRNTPCESPMQQAVIHYLQDHYDGGRLLVALGKWPCVMPAIGIPFRHTISESNRKIWRQLPQNPGVWVEWILRSDGDSADELMRAYPAAFQEFDLVMREKFGPGEWVEIYHRRPK